MELSNRKKKTYNLEEAAPNLYNPIYNYSSLAIDDGDKGTLISLEKDILYRGKMLGEIAYKIGDSLERAKGVFKKYSTIEGDPESFVTWYSTLGLNKDQVYLFRGRYNLGLDNPKYRDRIIALSDVAIKETINNKTPVEIKNKVLEGKLNSGSAIKKARVEIIQNQKSRPLEIDIEDAAIIYTETPEEQIEKQLKELKVIILNSSELDKKQLTKFVNLSIDVTNTISDKIFAIEEKLENSNNLKFPL